MKKFVLGPILAALAMFFWGFLYWGVLDFPYRSLGTVADESAAALTLGQLFPATGAYLLPSPSSGEAKVAELMKRGPIAEVFIVKEGMAPMEPAVLIKGYVHMLVLALLLTAMLCAFEKGFETWKCRVAFCVGIGLIVAVCELAEVIWWHHPWGWTLAAGIYNLVMYAIAGLVLAKFVTPKPAAATA